MSPWTAATRAVSHPLTHTRLAIRLNPARGDPARPFSPGDVLSGEAVLVVDNDEGVKDVKHKLSVQSVGVRVFWEARSHTEPVHSQEYHRGGSVFVPLTSGVEDVLLMPGIQGGHSVEASWSFEITLPEKSTVEESHNSSSKDKGKSSATVQLASGPPPSFAGESRSVEYIVEAAVVFADGAPSSELDERGHRVAGELELVTRTTFPFRPDGEKVMVSNEFSSAQWKKTLDVAGPEGRSLGTLNVAINPPPFPIPASFPSIPLDISLRLSPPAKAEKKKSGLFGGLGKGKEKKREEEEKAAAAASGQDSFVVESVTASMVVANTGEPDIVLSEVCSLNISSNHPTLSSQQGLSTEVHLDLASSAPANWDATLGSFTLPNATRQFSFSLSLQLSSPANPRTHPIVVDLALPFIGAPYQSAAQPHTSSGAPPGFDDAPPPGDPPSFADQSSQPPSFSGGGGGGDLSPPSFEPPTFGAATGGGSSRPGSSGPPGYH